MTPAAGLLTSLTALTSNILRTLLTMPGIAIRIAPAITPPAASEGAQQGVGERIRGLGSDLMFIRPGAVEQSGIELPGTGPGLYLEDARAIEAAQFPYVKGIAAQAAVGGKEAFIQVQAIYLVQNTNTRLLGTE